MAYHQTSISHGLSISTGNHMINPAWQWLAGLLVVPVVIPFIRWLVRSMVHDLTDGLSGKMDAIDKKHTESAQGQGKRIGDLESWTVAHDAVENERRRVADTRGIPIVDEGRKGRAR